MKNSNKGRINSIETLGALDGPGLRTVVFLQGCPLRCAYCHNPETWALEGGDELTPQALLQQLVRMKPYYGEKGGVTFSGGEPLLQAAFLLELLDGCQREGIHTLVDTAGVPMNPTVQAVLDRVDGVLIDLKMNNDEDYKRWIGGSFETTMTFLKAALASKTQVKVRQVIVPRINDHRTSLTEFKNILSSLGLSLDQVELIPYHGMAKTKYEALGLQYRLEGTPELSEEEMALVHMDFHAGA